jgi:hypothetical protein
MTNELRVAQHAIPRHVLARFSNDDGRLTVLRRAPLMKVLRNQAPENVEVHNHLNNWRDETASGMTNWKPVRFNALTAPVPDSSTTSFSLGLMSTRELTLASWAGILSSERPYSSS